MFEKESITTFSFQEIETSIADALKKLTGKEHNVRVSSIDLNAKDRGYSQPQMIIHFSENRPYVPIDELFNNDKNQT